MSPACSDANCLHIQICQAQGLRHAQGCLPWVRLSATGRIDPGGLRSMAYMGKALTQLNLV